MGPPLTCGHFPGVSHWPWMEWGSAVSTSRKAGRKLRRAGKPVCDFCGDPGVSNEFTVFGCRDFTICYGRDDAGAALIWSPDLGIPGEITDVQSDSGRVEVTVTPATGSAHPSEVVTGPVERERHSGGWQACRTCTPLAMARDWTGLAYRFGGGLFAVDPGAVAVIIAQLELFGWFATGEHWPLAQAPPAAGSAG